MNTISPDVLAAEQLALEKLQATRLSDSSASWDTPFGGFTIGDPFDNSVSAILDLYRQELKNPKFESVIQELILLEMGPRDGQISKRSRQKVGPYADNPLKSAEDYRTQSTGKAYAWEDTSIGGGPVLNPLWQFGIDDDIVPPSNVVYGGTSSNFYQQGMGRVYTDMYYANQRVLWMTFGMPKYNTLRYYLKTAIDPKLAKLANNPDMSISQKIGAVVGSTIGIAITLPIMAIVGLASIFDTFAEYVFGRVNKYYELRPAMHRYYKVCNIILASLSVNMNFSFNEFELRNTITDVDKDKLMAKFKLDPPPADASPEVKQKHADAQDLLDADLARMKEFDNPFSKDEYQNILASDSMFDIETLKYGPDIVRILNRRFRRRDAARGTLSGNGTITSSKSIRLIEETYAKKYNVERIRTSRERWTDALIAKETALGTAAIKKLKEGADALEEQARAAGINVVAVKETAVKIKDEFSEIAGKLEKALKYAGDAIDDTFHKAAMIALGDLMYIGFRIESGASTSESMSNSTGDSAIASTLKSTAAASRAKKFTLANGRTGFGPLDAVLAAGGAMVSKVGESLGINGLTDALIRGSGFLDIPEVWSDSSFSKSYSFDIELRSRYGDKVSIYQSIYIPLTMLIAGAFPLGIGKNAYTSPFLMQAFCKGMFSIPLGIVDSLSITRGASEHGWAANGLPTVVKVSISLKDLSPMVFLSMTDAQLLEPLRSNTSMQDYLMTLSGVELPDRTSKREMFFRKKKITALLWKKNFFNSEMIIHKIGSAAISRKFATFSARGVFHPGQ